MQSYTLRELIAKKIPIVLYACNKTSESNNDKTTNNHRATLDTCKIQQYLTTMLKDVTVINAAEFQECANVVQSTIVTKQNGNLCVSVLNGPLHRLKTGSTVFISNIDRNVNFFYFLKDKMRTASFVFSSAERLHFKRVMEIGVVRHERVHWLVNAVNERFGVEGSNYGVLKDFILPGRDEPYLKDEVSVVDGEFYVQVREEQQMNGLPKEYERRVRLYRLLSLVYAEEVYEKRIVINAYLRENCGLTEEDVLSSFVSTSWNDQRCMFYEDGLSFQSNHPNQTDCSSQTGQNGLSYHSNEPSQSNHPNQSNYSSHSNHPGQFNSINPLNQSNPLDQLNEPCQPNPLNPINITAKFLNTIKMAITKRLLLLIQDILTTNHPTILIGPTGTGKTSILQQLFNPTILNCSNDTDVLDITGNYRNEFKFVPGPFYSATITRTPFVFDEINLLTKECASYVESVISSGTFYNHRYERVSTDKTRVFGCMNTEGKRAFVSNAFLRITVNDFSRDIEDVRRVVFSYEFEPGVFVCKENVAQFYWAVSGRKRVSGRTFGRLIGSECTFVGVYTLFEEAYGGYRVEYDVENYDYTWLTGGIEEDKEIGGVKGSIESIEEFGGGVKGVKGSVEEDKGSIEGVYNLEGVNNRRYDHYDVENVNDNILNTNINTTNTNNDTNSNSDTNPTNSNPINHPTNDINPTNQPTNTNINTNLNPFNPLILTTTLKVLILQLQFCIKHALPVLLHGETSTGKTSLIYHLSTAYKKRLIRINNHKHTDSTDYLGKNVITGNTIVHTKGPLVRAMLNGDWLLIDEINLCSCDVLEVLNRLLDDNREIRIPETGEVVRPAPGFRVFATMNACYTGRHALTDAFMDRFVVKEMKVSVREVIGDGRCSFVVDVYDRLRVLRNFRSLMTLRDVFKIARRASINEGVVNDGVNENGVNENGVTTNLITNLTANLNINLNINANPSIEEVVWEYLGERQRDEKTRAVVRDAIKCSVKDIKSRVKDTNDIKSRVKDTNDIKSRVKDTNDGNNDTILNDTNHKDRPILRDTNHIERTNKNTNHKDRPFLNTRTVQSLVRCIERVDQINHTPKEFVLTPQHRKTMHLILKAWSYGEHVLLVGETGIGKTQIIEILAKALERPLTTVACHGGMDTSDLIGEYEIARTCSVTFRESALVRAMRTQGVILLDEINLPESSVIERLNSLLDSNTVYLTETNETVRNESFIVATMNPGTYAGKKELGDALRNRFTEIYFWFDDYVPIALRLFECYIKDGGDYDLDKNSRDCDLDEDWNGRDCHKDEDGRDCHKDEDGRDCHKENDPTNLNHTNLNLNDHNNPHPNLNYNNTHPTNLNNSYEYVLKALVERIEQYRPMLSIRKVQRMVQFFGEGTRFVRRVRDCWDVQALLDEACEVVGLVDGKIRRECVLIDDEHRLGCYPFYVVRGSVNDDDDDNNRDDDSNRDDDDCSVSKVSNSNKVNNVTDTIPNNTNSTTIPNNTSPNNTPHNNITVYNTFTPKNTPFKFSTHNFYALLRALFLSNNVLIEGAPGLGKTTIIKQLGNVLNIPVQRINLGICTEFTDLTGTYIPQNGKFVFVESQFIKALRANSIIILDEINLCTQSVIEGLNPLLDHRRTISVNNTLVRTNSLIFGTMNPSSYKGRRALPKSFLDRFVCVRFERFDGQEIVDILGESVARLMVRYGCTMRQCVRARIVGENVVVGRDVKYRMDGRRLRIGKTIIEWNNCIEGGSIGCCIERGIGRGSVDGITTTVNPTNPIINPITTTSPTVNTTITNPTPLNTTTTTNPTPLNPITFTNANDAKYVFISKNVKHLETLINALVHKVPVILTGTGRSSLLNHAAHLLNLRQTHIHLHNQTDITDLLGQYVKCASSVFKWQDSALIRALNHDITVIHSPDKVHSSVLDRISSLFDDNYLNLIEKGVHTYYACSTRFVMVVDELCAMSVSMVDRCVVVECGGWNVLDYVKVAGCYWSNDGGNDKGNDNDWDKDVDEDGDEDEGNDEDDNSKGTDKDGKNILNSKGNDKDGKNIINSKNIIISNDNDIITPTTNNISLAFIPVIINRAQILVLLCSARMNNALLKDLHIKMRINTYNQIIKELLADIDQTNTCNKDTLASKDQTNTCNVPYARIDQTNTYTYNKEALAGIERLMSRNEPILPNLVVDHHIKAYYNYVVVRMSRRENELVRLYNLIRSVDGDDVMRRCVSVLGRDNGGFKEMMEYVEVLRRFGVVSVREMKEKYLMGYYTAKDEDGRVENGRVENGSCKGSCYGRDDRYTNTNNTNTDHYTNDNHYTNVKRVRAKGNAPSLYELPFKDVLTFKDTRIKFDMALFNELTSIDPLLLLIKECDVLPDIRRLLIRTYKYGKTDGINTINEFIREGLSKMLTRQQLCSQMAGRDFEHFKRTIRAIEHCIQQHNDLNTFLRSMLNEHALDMYVYYRLRIVKLLRCNDKKRLERYKRALIRCYLARDDDLNAYLRVVRGVDTFTDGYCAFFYRTFFRRTGGTVWLFVVEMVREGYVVCDEMLNEGINDIFCYRGGCKDEDGCGGKISSRGKDCSRVSCGGRRGGCKDEVSNSSKGKDEVSCKDEDCYGNSKGKDEVSCGDENGNITTNTKSNTITTNPTNTIIDKPRDVNYKVLLHILTREWHIKTLEPFLLLYSYQHFRSVLFFLKELSLSKHVLPNKSLFYGVSLQYYGYDRDIKEEINALEVIKEVEMRYDVRCYRCCDVMEKVYGMLWRKDGGMLSKDGDGMVGKDGDGMLSKDGGMVCWCMRVFRMGRVNEMKDVVRVLEESIKSGGNDKDDGIDKDNGKDGDDGNNFTITNTTNSAINTNICPLLDPLSFYNRSIPLQPYNPHELALGQLFFKFNILKESVSPQLKALLILCFYYPYIPLIMYVSRAMDERKTWLVKDGREGGRGDVEDGMNDEVSGEDEEGDGGCGKEECEREDNDGMVGCRTKDREDDEDREDEDREEEDREEDDGREKEDEDRDQDREGDDDDDDDDGEKSREGDDDEDDNKEDRDEKEGLEKVEGTLEEGINDDWNDEIDDEDGEDKDDEDGLDEKDKDYEDGVDDFNTELNESDNFNESNDLKDLNSENSSGDSLFLSEDVLERMYRFEEGVRNDEQCCDTADNYETGGCKQQEGGTRALCAEEDGTDGNVDVTDTCDRIINSGAVDKQNVEQTAESALNFDAETDGQLIERINTILYARRAYKGDYRTGKKLNMKKIVQFIASDYQKDKIWYRKDGHTPTKIRIFIDNSRSMMHYNLQKLCFVYRRLYGAFKTLNIPTELYKFGEHCTLIHSPNDLMFNDSVTNYSFVENFCDGVNIVLTDGISNELQGACNERFLFLIFNREILRMESVRYVGDRMVRSRYLDGFRFKYEVVGDVEEIEESILVAMEEMVIND